MRGDSTAAERGWVARNPWLMAAVWLFFLFFPLLSILTNDEVGIGGKIGSIALAVAFAGVYLRGFKVCTDVWSRRDGEAAEANPWPYMIGLWLVAAAWFLVGGIAALGALPFVVAFAVFQMPWAMAGGSFVVAVVATVGFPLRSGDPELIWALLPILVGVSVATVIVRIIDGAEADRARLRTSLAIGDERIRVARDVHDVLGHSLTAMVLKAELADRLLAGIEPTNADQAEVVDSCRDQLSELRSIGRSSLAEVRSTVGGLRAVNLADELTVARTVLADAGVGLLVTGEVGDIPEVYRPTLAWVVREAVTNTVRHAKAQRCRIELCPTPGQVLLRVGDDGVGIGGEAEHGNGLTGLRERVEAAGAAIRFETVGLDGGSGTTVEVSE